MNDSSQGPYSKGTYKPCSCSNRNFYYYKTGEFIDSGNTSIASGGRNNFNLIKLYHIATWNKIYIFALHFGAFADRDTDKTNQISTLITYIASNLSSSANYLMLGDFNIEGPGEQAYINLLNQIPSNSPFVYDPLNDLPDYSVVNWYDDLTKFGNYFTVSTRDDNPSVDCLNEGDSNKSFDMIIYSDAIKNSSNNISYVNNSFTVYGQDGNHYNEEINLTPYVSYYQYIYNASDHFPVYADFTFKTNPLPVEIVNFKGIINRNNIELLWNTDTQLMNLGFNIERSVNSDSLKKIGFVSGKGNSNSPHCYNFSDPDINLPGNYQYRLKQIYLDGKFAYSQIVNMYVKGPTDYALLGNYPNPFNPSTVIEYQISTDSRVKLIIVDVLGREVKILADGLISTGIHRVTFNASAYMSGVYVCQLNVNGKPFAKKIMLLK